MKPIINSIIENIENVTLKVDGIANTNTLHIFYLSNDVPSLKYINNKINKAKKYQLKTELHIPKKLQELYYILNHIPKDDKIIIQYPINSDIFGDIKNLYQTYITKEQDVDGFLFDFLDISSCNTLSDFLNHKSFSPTAKGVLQILQKLNADIEGKNITVLGKGLTSGLPIGNSLAKLGANLKWLDKNCKKEEFIKTIQDSDVIISCTGAKNIINKDIHSLKEKCIYINIGMSINEKGVIIGDINYDDISLLNNTFYTNTTLNTTGVLTTINLISNCF